MNRRLISFFGLLLAAPASAGPTRAIQKATVRADAERLSKALVHKSGFVREQAARSLSALPASSEATALLTTCVQSAAEPGYVRAACAQALAAWRVPDVEADIIAAMDQVDPESRYWLAAALAQLGTRPARAHITSLTSDGDLFLATSAREWSR